VQGLTDFIAVPLSFLNQDRAHGSILLRVPIGAIGSLTA